MPAHIQKIFAGYLLYARLGHSHLKGPLFTEGGGADVSVQHHAPPPEKGMWFPEKGMWFPQRF